MIKAVIFDMDGTVLNTLDDIWVAINHALTQKQLPQKTRDEVRQAVGNGAFKLIERVVPRAYSLEETKALFHIYQSYYDTHSNVYTKPYEGIITLLENLKEKNVLIGVVSNKFEHLVQGLNQDVFMNLFDVAVGEVKGIPIKPAPDMVYKALDMLNVKPEEALFVGDSEVDIDTAFNARLTSVGVTWGFRDETLLREHNADYIIHHPKELLVVLDKEMKK
jgi:phosphoglycolate phosphatase